MAKRAKVFSVEDLKAFRPALIKFQDSCAAALTSAESDAGRTALHLRSTKLPYWKKECRVRRDELTRVRNELSVRKIMREADARSTADEQKMLDKAKRRLAEAEDKFERTKQWIRRLDKANPIFVPASSPCGPR